MNPPRILALFLASCLPACAVAQISIAMPPGNGTGWGAINSLDGYGYTYAVAQTLMTPDATNTRLDRVSFLMGTFSGNPSDFAAYLVQWDSGSLPAPMPGAPLWTSGLQSSVSLPAYHGSGWPISTTFETGGIDLQPDQTYAIVFYRPNAGSGNAPIFLEATSTDYAAGNAFHIYRSSASTSFSDLYTANTYSLGMDVAFGATFSAPGLTAVPEPAAAVAGLGLAFVAGLVALRLHQRHRSVVPPAPPHA